MLYRQSYTPVRFGLEEAFSGGTFKYVEQYRVLVGVD